MLAVGLGYVAAFGTNSPYQDEWHSVAVMTGHEPLTLAWLWSLENEHRIPLPRFLDWALFHVAGRDFRGAMYANVLGLGGLAAALLLAARGLRGRTDWPDALFPLLLLHWGQAYNLLFGHQIFVVAPVCFAGTALVVAARHPGRLSGGAATVAGLCLLLMPLCGGLGLAWVVPLTLWLAASTRRAWRAGSDGRAAAGVAAACVTGAAALSVAYFVGFDARYTPQRPSLPQTLQVALEFLSTAFGVLQSRAWWAAAGWLVAVSFCAGFWALKAFVHRPDERVRSAGFLAILAGVALEAAGVAWGRAGFGPGAGLAQRYTTMTALAVCAAYLSSLAYAPGRVGGALRLVLFATSLAMLWPNTTNGLVYGEGLRSRFAQCERDVRRGVPPAVIANQYSRAPNLLGRAWRKKQYARELVMLREAKVGWYRFLREDPAWREEPLPPTAPGRVLQYRLPTPTFVYALRFTFRYAPGPSFAKLHVTWQAVPSKETGTFAISLPRKDQDDTLLIWVDGKLNEFSIDQGEDASGCRISDVTLLVPPERR